MSNRPASTSTSASASRRAPGAGTAPASAAPAAAPAPSPPRATQVYLVGAGPGHPDLLTVRAARLLATAQVILPDDLVSDEILALASPSALIIPVGKRCGQPRITQAGIHALMLKHAAAGRTVVRLKSGDPLLFGRANEEIEALRAAGIRFEIVPGISAVFAAAASLKTPLTDRNHASKLILATAHHAAGKPQAAAWKGSFPSGSTLVLYMPGRDFAALSRSLLDAGLAPHTPVAAISRASTPQEQVTLTSVAALPGSAPGPAPLLLLIGEAIQIPRDILAQPESDSAE